MTDHVLDLLNKQNISFTVGGRDYLIRCLNPEHDDSNPSFRVDRVTGVSHCFSCGFKTNIFKHFGVVGNFTSIKVAKTKREVERVKPKLQRSGVSRAFCSNDKAFSRYQC